MKRIAPAKTVNEMDRKLREKYALCSMDLIRRASLMMYEYIRPMLQARRTIVLAGKGNNGSDGISLALLAAKDGLDVSLYYPEEAESGENLDLRREAREAGIPESGGLDGFDVVIDALLGAAFHPPVLEGLHSLIDKVNCLNAFRIAVDVPSAYLFRADLTISFSILKRECFLFENREVCGRIILFNPGFPDDELENVATSSFLLEKEDLELPDFSRSDFKNRRGHLALVGGSEDYTGAVVLSARSAFHSGVGLVTIFTSPESYLSISCYRTAMVKRYPYREGAFNALLIGPGMGDNADTSAFFSTLPKVIDASGLDYIKKGDRFSFKAILTPHLGEFRRLCARLCLPEDPKEVARYLEVVLVLKSSMVLVTDGKSEYFYEGRNPSLGVAGSGDVLSGIIASLLAEGLGNLSAAVNGVILHQEAGRIASEKYGYYDAEDLIDEVGRLR